MKWQFFHNFYKFCCNDINYFKIITQGICIDSEHFSMAWRKCSVRRPRIEKNEINESANTYLYWKLVWMLDTTNNFKNNKCRNYKKCGKQNKWTDFRHTNITILNATSNRHWGRISTWVAIEGLSRQRNQSKHPAKPNVYRNLKIRNN